MRARSCDCEEVSFECTKRGAGAAPREKEHSSPYDSRGCHSNSHLFESHLTVLQLDMKGQRDDTQRERLGQYHNRQLDRRLWRLGSAEDSIIADRDF